MLAASVATALNVELRSPTGALVVREPGCAFWSTSGGFGENHLVAVGVVGVLSTGNLLDGVKNHAAGLSHFFHSHTVAVVAVSPFDRRRLFDGGLPVNLVVNRVGVSPSNVVIDARGSDVGPGYTGVDHVLGFGVAHALESNQPDGGFIEHHLVFVNSVFEEFDLGHQAVGEANGNVSLDATDSGVIVVHTRTAKFLEQVEEHLTVAHAPSHQRQATNVRTVGAQPHQVRGQTLAFCCDQANVFGSLWHLDFKQVLGRIDVGVGPCHGAHVAETVAVGGDLGEVAGFGNLLNATVNVAEFGFSIDHGFAVDLDAQGPQTVRHRMLGAHCNPHLCHDFTSLNPTLIGWFPTEALGVVVHFIEVVVADFVLLLQRVESVRAVVRVEHTVHVFMTFELDTDQIPGFFFVPIGPNPNALDAGYRGGFGLRERDDNLNFQRDVIAFELFSDVDGVGVRGLVDDRLAHEVVDHFPAALSASVRIVRSRDH